MFNQRLLGESPFQLGISSQAIPAIIGPDPALSQRKFPTYTWKYHGKLPNSAFFFCPFKLHGELMTTCEMSQLSSSVIHKLNYQRPK